MKKAVPIFCLLVLTVTNLFSQQSDFPVLTGPYFGQKPPGMTPELFSPGFISAGLQEGACVFMPSGDECVFMVTYRKPHSNSVFSSLATSRIVDGRWSAPQFLPFSGIGYLDVYPFISYDGKELFFASSRPTGRAELKNQHNLWRCRRVNNEWSEPEPLPSPINGRGDMSGPSL